MVRRMLLAAGLLAAIPTAVEAHPHPGGKQEFQRIMPMFGGGMVDMKLTVFANPAGYPRLVNGKSVTFCHKYQYDIEMWDVPGFPNQFIGCVIIPNWGFAFSADPPIQWITPIEAGRGNPGVWSVPTFNPTLPASIPGIQFLTATPETTGIRFTSTWRFCIYTNAEPVPGNLTFTGRECLSDQMCTYLSADIPYIVPCGPPTCDVGGVPPPPPPPDKEIECLHNFEVAQVYPAVPATQPGIPNPGCWFGNSLTPFTNTVVPGVLCLATNANGVLNANAFVDPTCCTNPVIQFVNLQKQIPGSRKCPLTYRPANYFQSATTNGVANGNGLRNIRTWWPLMYSMPGTKITLRVGGTCLTGTGVGQNFTDTWCWTVVANPETFRLLIDLFHTSAIGLLEIPCIVGEDIYQTLLGCAGRLATAIATLRTSPTNPTALNNARLAVIECESTILCSTIFSEFVDREFPFDYLGTQPIDVVPNGPPGNLATRYPSKFPADARNQCGVIGIIDTCENPCACKLLTDLDDIAVRFGVALPPGL